jgi:hypothetical protein
MLAIIVAVLLSGAAVAQEHKPAFCAFNDRLSHETESYDDCGWVDADGRPHVKPEYWKRFEFDGHGLASARFGDRWYWFHLSGRSAETMLYDTWAEDFSSGLARTPRGGKIGFMDRRLKLVIPARYDGALPFDNGVAEVCNGCSLVRHGEHSIYEGGEWFCLDRRGRERRRKGRNC